MLKQRVQGMSWCVIALTGIAFAAAATLVRGQDIKKTDFFAISNSVSRMQMLGVGSKFSPRYASIVNVTTIEELYAGVNNPSNAGSLIVMSPGVYTLSANDPSNVPRPNGGRIDLLENMSLQGVTGNPTAVVIDAINLPTSSYSAPPIVRSGAIRMGRGSNSVEWLTIRNGIGGNGNIETDIAWPGTAHLRIAHIVSTGALRGIDVRNIGSDQAGRVIDAEIVDNDLFENQRMGLRIANSEASGGVVTATLIGNRSHNNSNGLVVESINANSCSLTVSSFGDRFYENGYGANIGGGISIGVNAALANGNITRFTAYGTLFENNNVNGLGLGAGTTTSFALAASNNIVEATLLSCRLVGNQAHDLEAIAAESSPESIGQTGTNNTVTILMRGTSPKFRTESFTNGIPEVPVSGNVVILSGIKS